MLVVNRGEYLAHRVDVAASRPTSRQLPRPARRRGAGFRHTPFAGIEVRETRLRETKGMSVAGIRLRGRLQPACPATRIDPGWRAGGGRHVRAGGRLNRRLAQSPGAETSGAVLIIGAGRGPRGGRGPEAQRHPDHVVEKDARALSALAHAADVLVDGDAADREVLARAGLADAASVVLTTNDDAVNIYLAVLSAASNRTCARQPDHPRAQHGSDHRALTLQEGAIGTLTGLASSHCRTRTASSPSSIPAPCSPKAPSW
jgi:hypothetical protein